MPSVEQKQPVDSREVPAAVAAKAAAKDGDMWARREEIRVTHVIGGLKATLEHPDIGPEQKAKASERLQNLAII